MYERGGGLGPPLTCRELSMPMMITCSMKIFMIKRSIGFCRTLEIYCFAMLGKSHAQASHLRLSRLTYDCHIHSLVTVMFLSGGVGWVNNVHCDFTQVCSFHGLHSSCKWLHILWTSYLSSLLYSFHLLVTSWLLYSLHFPTLHYWSWWCWGEWWSW